MVVPPGVVVISLIFAGSAGKIQVSLPVPMMVWAHTTDASFPFVGAPGLSLYEARLFDVGDAGDEHFVVASVHV